VQSAYSIDQYNYSLPEELIAQKSVEPRDASRLLVLDRKSQSIQHRKFSDLPEYLNQGDMVVANNTKVMKARLLGNRVLIEKGKEKTGGKVEFVMLEKKGDRTWEGLFHASGKYIEGFTFDIPIYDQKKLRGKIIKGSAESEHGNVVVEFDRDPIESGAGLLPLPHYIERDPEALPEALDEQMYQTVYAKTLGSAAAPTAGLHFTPEVIRDLNNKQIDWKEITLHVGLGTFRPVKTQDIRDHRMHEEQYFVERDVAQEVTKAKLEKRKFLAVGTTSVRVLESVWDAQKSVCKEGGGKTSIFIYPGFQFKVVDRLLTNFHLPRSSLLMLVCAFADREFILSAYEEAVAKKYRFFSYGDAMLIL
jgi:S-adenosylmethionine:tRNA ribosyltransferase-isomerase